jgi:hypothetical protein
MAGEYLPCYLLDYPNYARFLENTLRIYGQAMNNHRCPMDKVLSVEQMDRGYVKHCRQPQDSAYLRAALRTWR